MFRAALFACVVGSAVAFAPAPRVRAITSVMAEKSRSIPILNKPKNLDGSMAGDEGFDPLGLSNINDLGFDLYWMREAELKHARVAMLAFLGMLWTEGLGLTVPGFPAGKNAYDALWESIDTTPPVVFSAFLFLAIVEVIGLMAVNEGRNSGRAPGYFAFNPLNFGRTPESMKDLATKEIRNGRLAMWGCMGILHVEATQHISALTPILP